MNPGDRLTARPCDVTVAKMSGDTALGYCSVCQDTHIIDVTMFRSGRGPWRYAVEADQ